MIQNYDSQPSRSRFQILAISGGGYRGLFSATVLAALEATVPIGTSLADYFDLITGTSVGGLLAIGLASGIRASDLQMAIRMNGPDIFKRASVIQGSRYSAAALEKAVVKILGRDAAKQPFSSLPRKTLVCATDFTDFRPVHFRSYSAGPRPGSSETLLDIALATTAAPTYFPPHVLNNHLLVDGGLFANAPDAIAILDAEAHLDTTLENIHVLSIGTMSPTLAQMPTDHSPDPGRLGWVRKFHLIEGILEVQEQVGCEMARGLIGGRWKRLDQKPSAQQAASLELDNISADTTQLLQASAAQAVDLSDPSLGNFLRTPT
jgi:uncharacterized protein